MSDYYSTLGVSRDATADDIKRAYRRLASQHHPDKGGDKEQFQRIQQAYDVLGDAQKRAQYENPAPQFGQGGFPGGFSFSFGGGFPFGDIFQQFQQQHHQHRTMMRMSLWIRLQDVVTGGRRPVSVASPHGTQTIEIDIPRGINDGDTVRYGGLAPGGSDLAIQFRIHPDPKWTRDGLNLITEESLSVWDLILGTDLMVKDITGRDLSIAVPPRTQPRTLLRLRGHGITDQHGQTGDILVKVYVVIPANIPAELISAIEKHRV